MNNTIKLFATYLGASRAQKDWLDGNYDLLTVGKKYEVAAIGINPWASGIQLVGFEGAFNLVCFDLYDENGPTDERKSPINQL